MSATGSQNLSFDISSSKLQSRTDRAYQYDDYWLWAFPDLQPPINFSFVVHDGDEGFACFTNGQNSFFAADPSVALGYADSYLTDYLIHQAHQFALPWLLRTFLADFDRLQQYQVQDSFGGETYLAVEHSGLGLALLINTTSHLPYAVRSQEYHVVYGNSTSDLVLSAWAEVNIGGQGSNTEANLLLPYRLQTIYNSKSVLEDFMVDAISINAELSQDFFKPDILRQRSNGQSETFSKLSKPSRSPEYPRSEVHELFETGLWSGPWGEYYNVSDVVISHPFPSFKQISTIYVGYPDYVQILVEFEDGLLITDAAPHRSKIILDWVDMNMRGKRITYVVPSHHHRDHAGGVDDYVAAGATLVVPEVARELYNFTGKVGKMETYTDLESFVLKDESVEFALFGKRKIRTQEIGALELRQELIPLTTMNLLSSMQMLSIQAQMRPDVRHIDGYKPSQCLRHLLTLLPFCIRGY